MVTWIPLTLTFATSGRPPAGAVPSPMSRVPVPFSVIVPSALSVACVIQPVMVIHWLSPMMLVPLSCTSRSPFAVPVLVLWAPTPNVPPASSMPLKLAPAGKIPAPPAVTTVVPTSAAARSCGNAIATLATSAVARIVEMIRLITSFPPIGLTAAATEPEPPSERSRCRR